MLHVPHVVEVEAPPALLLCICLLVLGLECLIMRLGTRSQFVLRVCEEVVRTVADKIRATDFRVGDAELRRALVGARHGLLAHELLYGRVS
jgi:hypothetical protein